jgi:hypothetical protein
MMVVPIVANVLAQHKANVSFERKMFTRSITKDVGQTFTFVYLRALCGLTSYALASAGSAS